MLERKCDAEPQEQMCGVLANLGEADEGVHHRGVLPRHVAAGRIWGRA